RSCPLSPQLLSSLTRAGRGPTAVDDGQQHSHTGPTLGAVVGFDPAAMLLDDLLHDRQAEPGALGLARHVGVEDPAEELALESRPIVTYGHRRVIVLVLALLAGLQAGRDLEPRLRRAFERLESIGDQVVEDLAHAAAIGLDAFEPLVQAQVD